MLPHTFRLLHIGQINLIINYLIADFNFMAYAQCRTFPKEVFPFLINTNWLSNLFGFIEDNYDCFK